MVEHSDLEKRPSSPLFDDPEKLLTQMWHWLENVCDPEVPVLSVLDLGVVRSITVLTADGGRWTTDVGWLTVDGLRQTAVGGQPSGEGQESILIHITPTYTGCPAMSMIAANIRLEMLAHGLENVRVVEVLSPAWTTDWMSESGKKKLLEYGIAPPLNKARMDKMLFSDTPVPCPLCGSENTERISEFGSTACKSLHRCLDCREPFDYFKCH